MEDEIGRKSFIHYPIKDQENEIPPEFCPLRKKPLVVVLSEHTSNLKPTITAESIREKS